MPMATSSTVAMMMMAATVAISNACMTALVGLVGAMDAVGAMGAGRRMRTPVAIVLKDASASSSACRILRDSVVHLYRGPALRDHAAPHLGNVPL